MWTLVTRAKTRKKKRHEFITTIASLLIDSRSIKGNAGFDYHVDEHDNNNIIITSFWESKSDLENYTENELFKVLKGAVKTLCEEDDTRYYKVTI